MARPVKRGLDYFSFDTDFFNDRKIRRLNKNSGLPAIAVYVFLLTTIYKENGYFITVDDNIIFDFSDDLKLDESALKAIIGQCIDVELFDQQQYKDNKILTSRSIQRRYLKICKDAKRKNFDIPTVQCVLTDDDILEITGIDSEETPINSEETGINSEESTQSKVKERIIKKSKEEENIKIFTFTLFSSFSSKLNTTLKKHMRYIGGGDPQDYLTLYDLLIQSVLIDIKKPESLTVAIVHNYACYLIESLSDLDKQNFTIKYFLKHYHRINSGLNAKLKMRTN